MAHWKRGFPSKFLQASDLDGGPLVGTIQHVTSEDVGSGESQERKLVVSFTEPHLKGVVLNLTRAEAIEGIVGDPDTDHWSGHRIKIVRGSTRFQGKRVACIAIEALDDIDATMQPLKSEAF